MRKPQVGETVYLTRRSSEVVACEVKRVGRKYFYVIDILPTAKAGGFPVSLLSFPASRKLAFSFAFQLLSGSYGLSTG